MITPGRTRSDPSGILRRRTAAGKTSDEVFTRNLRWEPTAHFRKYELGHNDDDHVEITPAEAAAFVRRVAHRARPQNVDEPRAYSRTEEKQAFLANAKESAKRRREMPPEEQRPFPRPDRFSGEPLGTDGDGHIRTRRSE
uniref:hypothetical protein n=1 Tax=Saccharopolyspora galaxeae TaxID=2781241 RepID=UPI001F17E0F7|nr:hypothetical protein [Saccharopolyspora sp. HNM0986]